MREELKPLTSLRFFAALAVVFHHLPGRLWFERGAFDPLPLGSAVAFFFILSGFVLHYSYRGRMQSIGWLRFAVQRFLRIWPAHIAVILVCWLWIATPDVNFQLQRQSARETVQVLLLLQAWSQNHLVFWGLNGPSWSISAELFFYLGFPWLLIVLNRLGASRAVLLACAFTVAWLLVASHLLFDPDARFSAVALGYISPLARVGEFCLGMALSHRISDGLVRLREKGMLFWTGAEITVLAVVVLVMAHVQSFASLVGESLGPVAEEWVRWSGGMPAFVLVIAVFAVGGGAVSRLLRLPLLVWLGTISFAIYLVHQPLINHWRRAVVPTQDSVMLQVIGYSAVVLGSSALLHRFVELPGISLGRALAQRLPGPRSPASTPTPSRS